MKSKYIIALVVAVLMIGSLIAYGMTRERPATQHNANTNQYQLPSDKNIVDPGPSDIHAGTNANNQDTSATLPSARYVEYTPAALTKAESEPGQTVLYFHADWCPICQALEPSIRQHLSSLPAGLTILKVDYDTATALKQRYGITYQHTFVQVDSAGNTMKLWSGSTDAAAIAGELI